MLFSTFYDCMYESCLYNGSAGLPGQGAWLRERRNYPLYYLSFQHSFQEQVHSVLLRLSSCLARSLPSPIFHAASPSAECMLPFTSSVSPPRPICSAAASARARFDSFGCIKMLAGLDFERGRRAGAGLAWLLLDSAVFGRRAVVSSLARQREDVEEGFE